MGRPGSLGPRCPGSSLRRRLGRDGRRGRRRPGRAAAGDHPRRARPARPSPAARDRAWPLVAGRSRPTMAAAALPLADRVEWAVFSLLSTAGRLSESAFFERIAALFTGHDLPDEALVPRLPRQLPQPGQHARPARHLGRPAPALARAQRARRRLADTGPPARDACLDRRRASRSGGSRGRASGELAGRPRAARGPRRGSAGPPDDVDEVDVHLVRPRSRSRSCSRSSGRRCSASRSCAATLGSRRTSDSSGSSWSPPSERSSSATSSSDRRSSGQRWRPATGTSSRRTTCATFARRTRRSTLVDLEPYIGLDPAIERAAASRCRCSAG